MEHAVVLSRAKGSGVLGYLHWYSEEYGVEQLLARVARIPESERPGISADSATLGVIPTGWYESASIHRLLEVLTEGLSPDEITERARAAADHSVETAMNGLFKLAFQFLVTPERYAKHIQRFWNQLHNTGIREVEVVGPGEAISTISDWPGHHPFMCELVTFTTAAVFRRMGLQDVRTSREMCIDRGDPYCRSVLRWRP